MFKRNLLRVLLLAPLLPGAAFALGLGDIHLKSTLNAPLDADIDLVGANAEDLNGLRATLASRDTFARSGLDYPSFLGNVTFTPEKSPDGRFVLHVHSADMVREPFATLLIEADWARGHVVREYTVLLDPPVFSSPSAVNAAVAAPSAAPSARSGAVEHTAAPASAPSTIAASNNASPSPPPSAPVALSAPVRSSSSAATSAARAAGSYTVRRGDTLTSIASQNYPGADRVQRERQLVAIYRGNQSAFEGNMNELRSGATLSLPGDAEIAAISPGEAQSEVHQQYSSWNSAHGNGAAAPSAGSGQLKLVPPQAPQAAQAPASTAAAPAGTPAGNGGNAAALQQRVQQLETQLQDSQRLLQVRNDQLAALQSQLSQAQAAAKNAAAASSAPAATPSAPAVTTTSAPAATPAPSAAANTPTPPAETPPVSAAPPQPVTPPPATPAKPKTTAAVSAESGNSIIDLLEEWWYVPAGLVLILIALLVMRHVRARQEDEFDRSLGRLQPSFDSTSTGTIRTSSDTMPVRALPSGREGESYRVEESGTHEQPVIEEPAEHVSTISTGEHVALDAGGASGQPVGLDQGDPLAEADFHMAYGLYDQAADLVQIAISREPNRRDLKLKLLEVYFVWGNKDRFLQTAHELAATRDQAMQGEWEKIVIMGRQIAPEDSLFSSTGALAGAASAGVDLNLEGGQNRVDFDLLGEPSVSAGGPVPGGVDLDLGAALGDGSADEPTGEANKLSDSGVDFVLDDPERGNDATGSTREMPGSPPSGNTATVQTVHAGASDAEAPTVEQPQLHGGDNPTIRQKIDAAARAGLTSADQTAELAIDDLGLDLGSLEAGADDVPGGADAPTMLAGLDDDTRRLLARAEAERRDSSGSTATQQALSGAPSTSNTGTWLFTDTDFASVVPPEQARGDAPTELVTQIKTQIAPGPQLDTNSTSRLAALDPNDLDVDFGELGAEQGVNGVDLDLGGVDLDVGQPNAGEGTFVQTQKISPDDMPLPELEPATMSEVGTKLDLARAYMDMGDPEGARSILSEVLTEGSVSQKQEARRLMDTLPG